MNLTSAEPHVVEIDGTQYTINMLDATKGYPLYCKLLGKAGEVLEGVGKLDGKGEELALSMLGRAMRSLSPELVGELIKVFGTSSSVRLDDGKTPNVGAVFAMHFAGRYGHMMSWLIECAKVNFADFLPQDLLAKMPGGLLARFQSQSPATSSGSSTAP
jgi:hypothetical protein